jgi:hypothetical protein
LFRNFSQNIFFCGGFCYCRLIGAKRIISGAEAAISLRTVTGIAGGALLRDINPARPANRFINQCALAAVITGSNLSGRKRVVFFLPLSEWAILFNRCCSAATAISVSGFLIGNFADMRDAL